MKVVKEINAAIATVSEYKMAGKTIGLVPTMGALHEGHLSLIRHSIHENDITAVSIFVNPIQFNSKEDFDNYPITLAQDLEELEKIGCSLVFVPSKEEMYPTEPSIKIHFGQLENIMEGLHRSGHFSGVAMVVLKLFHVLAPSRAYFGQKDLQQYKIIEQMVRDTSLNIELNMMPIIRNEAGLALSSRNQRLSENGRIIAAEINKALTIARQHIAKNESVAQIITKAKNHLALFPEIEIEYLELVQLKDLSPVNIITGTNQLVLCFAGYIEGIRLIDNLIIE